MKWRDAVIRGSRLSEGSNTTGGLGIKLGYLLFKEFIVISQSGQGILEEPCTIINDGARLFRLGFITGCDGSASCFMVSNGLARVGENSHWLINDWK